MTEESDMEPLVEFLKRVPSVDEAIGAGVAEDGSWWVKFGIDIAHPLAWNVVQELGHILNYLSLEERLPTTFMPVSPPPYMNGGPREFLSWVIECRQPDFTPANCAEWLEGRLPTPVESTREWTNSDEHEMN